MLICRKPIKTFPELLIYNNGNNYKMFSTKLRGVVGEMAVEPRKDLYISKLVISEKYRGQGYGTRFMNFAKVLSKKAGLNGRLRVLASLIAGADKQPPHVFYRKYGFTSGNQGELKQIDECIKNNTTLPQYFKPIYMFYPDKR